MAETNTIHLQQILVGLPPQAQCLTLCGSVPLDWGHGMGKDGTATWTSPQKRQTEAINKLRLVVLPTTIQALKITLGSESSKYEVQSAGETLRRYTDELKVLLVQGSIDIVVASDVDTAECNFIMAFNSYLEGKCLHKLVSNMVDEFILALERLNDCPQTSLSLEVVLVVYE